MSTSPVIDVDAILVRRARRGDERAFEQIVARYRHALVRYAESVLRTRDGQAEDVVQEALWRAYRTLVADDRPLALSGWLYAIVRNACVDQLRRRNAANSDLAELPLTLATSDDAYTSAARAEELRAVLRGIAALPERQRALVEQSALAGVPHAVAGARLGISETASKVTLTRARQALRRELVA